MGYFYEGLGDGLAKDVALQQAKLRFREKASSYKKHPFFWAGFILTGNQDPMPSIDQRSWWTRMMDWMGMAA